MQDEIKLDRIHTRQQVAELLSISLKTLSRMEGRGEMPRPIQITGRLRGYRESDLKAWLDRRGEAA